MPSKVRLPSIYVVLRLSQNSEWRLHHILPGNMAGKNLQLIDFESHAKDHYPMPPSGWKMDWCLWLLEE